MQHELGLLFTEALPTFTGLRGTSQVIQQSVGDIAGLQQFVRAYKLDCYWKNAGCGELQLNGHPIEFSRFLVCLLSCPVRSQAQHS